MKRRAIDALTDKRNCRFPAGARQENLSLRPETARRCDGCDRRQSEGVTSQVADFAAHVTDVTDVTGFRAHTRASTTNQCPCKTRCSRARTRARSPSHPSHPSHNPKKQIVIEIVGCHIGCHIRHIGPKGLHKPGVRA